MAKSKKESSNDTKFCLVCGKKLDTESSFCKHCGAPSEAEKPKKSPKERKSRRAVLAVLIITIIIIASISLYFIINFEDVNEHEYFKYSPTTTPESVTLELDMESGSTEIKFTSDPNEPVVNIDYFKKWRGTVTQQPNYKTSSNKVSFSGSKVLGEADSELTIVLRSDVKYTIDAKASSGSIIMAAEDLGLTFGSISMESSSGSSIISGNNITISEKIKTKSSDGSCSVSFANSTIKDFDASFSSGSTTVKLENCLIGDLDASGDSGSLTIISKNTKISFDSTWKFDIDSGSIGLVITQKSPLGANIKVDSETSGIPGIDVNFNGNASLVRGKFSATSSDGDISMTNDLGFDSPVSNSMDSSNYNNTALDQFEFELKTGDGDIEVEAKNS